MVENKVSLALFTASSYVCVRIDTGVTNADVDILDHTF